jgi:hypothetical protein
MSERIIIIGGLSDPGERVDLIERLQGISNDDYIWEWVRAFEEDDYHPPSKIWKRYLHELREKKQKNEALPKIVKLHALHNRDANQLYGLIDPVVVPRKIDSIDALYDWLVSPHANLIPCQNWYLTQSQAAFVAIMCKLIRNKSWAKNTSGHHWTTEQNLFGQAPVKNPDFPDIRKEALQLVKKLSSSGFLISKGGSQGKTKLEWAIQSQHLPTIKDCLLRRSFDKIVRCVPDLQSEDNAEMLLRSNSAGLSERILATCRSRTE